ncbi:FecR family protein [Sphingobacterium faecale]|uniref:FecR domain-containing protein n=1 Tax=Sphingobacterium faecale TaxID=2803775 RepID=A0ABS1R303_9SPHI|nr:FecR family protein [Sphingobacterium faecale]MBL1408266.1 FecR domain-containing protein [Sphingobacterium faecale]
MRLIKLKIEGSITADELILLNSLTAKNPYIDTVVKKAEDEKKLLEDVTDCILLSKEDEGGDWNSRLEKMTISRINTVPEKRRRVKSLRYASVAIILVFLGFIWYVSKDKNDATSVVLQDLLPGKSNAVIKLSNGEVVELSGSKNGVIMGESLTYEDGALIVPLTGSEALTCEIHTPRGGQYQVTLSDGTKVWLNADSKLTYPSQFDLDKRVVELVGEAYFEVAKNIVDNVNKPFVVKTKKQEIEVLGTSFNTTAYMDDDCTYTTLVEGKVQIKDGKKEVFLSPGEQCMTTASGLLEKKRVDVSQFVAWRNDEFFFYETELKEVVRMLGRWYDFETVNEESIPDTHMYGTISREKRLTEVIHLIQASGLKFRIEKKDNKNYLIVLR